MRLPAGAMPEAGSFVPKAALEDGAYYVGECRNATVARWCAAQQCFFYWRFKFGSRYVERIKAPEDEKRFDVFVAHRIIETPDAAIPILPADAA